MKNLLLLSTLLVGLIACGPSPKEELKALKDEVIAIHDEVMPKMSQLMKAKKELQAMADSSLMQSDSINAKMYSELASEIANANESMMQWMHQFESDFKGTNEEIKKYLEDQKVAIQQVKEDMNSSLAKGLEVLEQY